MIKRIINWFPTNVEKILSSASTYFFNKALGKGNELNELGYSSEGWNEKRTLAKKNGAIWFFISERLDDIDIFFSVWWRKLIDDPYYYVMYRWIWKSHLINSGLPKGKYHDMDNQMLYVIMNMIKKYVDDENPLWVLDEPPNRNIPRYQIETAIVCKEAYDWWKNYPNRLQQIEDIYEELPEQTDDVYNMFSNLNKPDKRRMEIYDKIHKEKEKLDKEAENMLIKIMKVRGGLWS